MAWQDERNPLNHTCTKHVGIFGGGGGEFHHKLSSLSCIMGGGTFRLTMELGGHALCLNNALPSQTIV